MDPPTPLSEQIQQAVYYDTVSQYTILSATVFVLCEYGEDLC